MIGGRVLREGLGCMGMVMFCGDRGGVVDELLREVMGGLDRSEGG